MLKEISQYVSLLFVLFFLYGCDKESENVPTIVPVTSENQDTLYKIPQKLDDGLDVASADSVNISSAKLSEMIGYINNIEDHEIHSILIMKDNKLVLEQYFEGDTYSKRLVGLSSTFTMYNYKMRQFMASVTKSITSIAAGVAFQLGYLKSVDNPLYTYYPEYADLFTGDKRNITIKQLLNMTSGLEFDEYTYPYGDSRNDITKLFNTKDPMKFLFSKPLVTEPGKVFYYNSGSPNIIADLVSKASGKDFLYFCSQHLMNRLDINDFEFEQFNSGNYFASGGLHMRARDLLKLGYLFLNDGVWNGDRILSSDWVKKSVEASSYPQQWTNATEYGYFWWRNRKYIDGKSFQYYYAAGWGDQYMFIVPEYNLIAIFLSGHFKSIPISPFDLFHNYILRGVTK